MAASIKYYYQRAKVTVNSFGRSSVDNDDFADVCSEEPLSDDISDPSAASQGREGAAKSPTGRPSAFFPGVGEDGFPAVFHP